MNNSSEKNQKNLPVETVVTGNHANTQTLAHKILGEYGILTSRDGKAYLYNQSDSHEPVYKLGSKNSNAIILKQAHQADSRVLSPADLKEFNETYSTCAFLDDIQHKVSCYVENIEGGIEIDLGDEDNTHAFISLGKVSLLKKGSKNRFYRDNNYQPFPYPSPEGDISRLDSYLGNMNKADRVLFIVFLAYTLAHPKSPETKYVILVLLGGQGTGKSFLCKIISALLSPSLVGNQILPKNQKDLVVVAQNAQVVFFDNVRKLTQQQSDDLCVMVSGGHISCRQLYTNDEKFVMPLHAGVVLNGIHDFITESDLAQRTLTLRLSSIDEENRVSEKQLQSNLEKDLPLIFKGLLDLIAQLLGQLPGVEITNPERMIDFVHWLAAKEKIDDVSSGTYQKQYSANIQEGQIESIMDDVLAATVTEFSQNLKSEWKDEPRKLFTELSQIVLYGSERSSQWPKTVNAMSKKLRSLEAALKAQGVYLEFGRGQTRWIRISTDTTESEY